MYMNLIADFSVGKIPTILPTAPALIYYSVLALLSSVLGAERGGRLDASFGRLELLLTPSPFPTRDNTECLSVP